MTAKTNLACTEAPQSLARDDAVLCLRLLPHGLEHRRVDNELGDATGAHERVEEVLQDRIGVPGATQQPPGYNKIYLNLSPNPHSLPSTRPQQPVLQ